MKSFAILFFLYGNNRIFSLMFTEPVGAFFRILIAYRNAAIEQFSFIRLIAITMLNGLPNLVPNN